MTGQVTALVALAGAVLLLGLLVSLALGRRKRSDSRTVVARKPEPRAQRGALPSAPVPGLRGPVKADPRRPAVRIAVAEPGDRESGPPDPPVRAAFERLRGLVGRHSSAS